MAGNTGTSGATVAGRVLAVLAAFDETHRRLTLSDIARRADLPLPTTHRLVAEVVRWGGLRRRDDGRYEVGRRLWDVGILAPVQGDLREVALPHLQDVQRTTGETTHLAVRDGLWALYVERLLGRSPATVLSRTGARLPLHATAVGKVLLAAAPAEVADRALNEPEQVTAYTVTDAARLRGQLAECRRRGFARTAQEMTPGAWSVAVPVTTPDGAVVAALGIVVTVPGRDLVRLVPVLQVAARAIARDLPHGWQ